VRISIPWHVEIGHQAALGDRAILYALGKIKIGKRATISQNAHLCAGTHDWRDPARSLLKTPIQIGADAWVCADAFVGPGVRIGSGAILGARGVAMKDLAPGHIGTGNPMQVRPAQ
jgi:putative colanic acid biosynthesis acetyltransferase WcaF